jgi:large subunit ribosomal protein L29
MPSKAAELRELTDQQLLERAESAKEELFNLRFQLATGQLDNPSTIKKVRHEIARIATVMRERDIEARLDALVVAAETRSATETEPERGTQEER